MKTAEYWIEHLGLQPHPEGGYYKETYRSNEAIEADALPQRYEGGRSFGTAIYFLITSKAPSNFHRLLSDELWFFHAGDPLRVYGLKEGEESWQQDLGMELEKKQSLQVIIPKDTWFAAEVLAPNSYTLISCTVSPGFDFRDFELAKRKEIISNFPQDDELIERLTK
ncbi:cupin domain-containing protein [Peijinzhouia sedimentorum]